ncbi:D-alanyl-D-alanine carboxypeptidase/D-alanyl-D-alanine-endopeptidase [Lentibacillus sp. CBA3610]|uniref:D-alanyl-D-alanine carboxypeptidase/D-alanyl-D-alanine endopeptidase n=1 Tax=Lentibacillus sp. CBA3610 TaxID=2518176 RepID=UPI001595F459|nr:D-alanyl-D-alanine carboxypeptidase/D-alanyl-D-alanine-endopeptidase [Lentibacillus sp. CBA3610]QKY68853.1 D-alanyl-D-alanine carboxypeptidase/D-alanyl-D-alanine-endopeptidase [Lentibacillus sp. CBA3610]
MNVKHYRFGIIVLVFMLLMTSTAINKSGDSAAERGDEYMMAEELERFINNEPKLQGAITGISIRNAATGEKIYDHMGDTRLRPASNMKLLTAAAALSVLGKDYTLSTQLLTDGSVTAGRLNGNLFLKGMGDPTLLPEDIDMFAKKLKEGGIDTVDGDIIADDTWYDDQRLSSGLIWGDEQWYYGAQISALTVSPDKDYDAGTVVVEVQPGDAGEKPNITVTPDTNYVQVSNNAKTIASGGEEDLTVEREHGGNTIEVEGTIPFESANVKEWIAVWEPTGYVLDLFKRAMEEQDITWTGDAKTGITPQNSETLYTHNAMPLSELLVPFMKLSNNTHAEMLVKEMGKVMHDEGSWEKGLEVVETEMKKLGLDTENLNIKDGSGISHMNLLSPDEISKLLHSVQDKQWFDVFLNALPIAGETDRMVGGTLRYRMENQNVHAKTGTIDGVSTLSGYTETEKGDKLIFSIMLNNLLDEEDGPVIEDKIVEMIATHK